MKKTEKCRAIRQAAVVLRSAGLQQTLRSSLLEFLIGSGIQTLEELLEQERTLRCGPRYEHSVDREAYRFGRTTGELILGGRRVCVPRPRVRTKDGREVLLPSWTAFSREDPLQARAVEQMLIGVSTRKYHRSLEEVSPDLKVSGLSKSAVSRRFVAATQAKVEALVRRDLSTLDLPVLMIDGVYFVEHVILVALGIDRDGRKHVLGLWEGATENATACKALLADLVERGLDTEHALLCVIDGSKALAHALKQVFGLNARIQRCQVHKKRNVLEHLPERLRGSIAAAMSRAYACADASEARRRLLHLAAALEKEHPSAAHSLREGLDETLTVKSFGLAPVLEKTLSSTNTIENLMGTVRRVTGRVKHWRGGSMIVRWATAGLLEAERGFRRVKGFQGLKLLVQALGRDELDKDTHPTSSKEAA